VQVLVADEALPVLDLSGEPFRELARSCAVDEVVVEGVLCLAST